MSMVLGFHVQVLGLHVHVLGLHVQMLDSWENCSPGCSCGVPKAAVGALGRVGNGHPSPPWAWCAMPKAAVGISALGRVCNCV